MNLSARNWTSSWIIIYTIFAGIKNFKSSYESLDYIGIAFAVGSILVVVAVYKLSQKANSTDTAELK